MYRNKTTDLSHKSAINNPFMKTQIISAHKKQNSHISIGNSYISNHSDALRMIGNDSSDGKLYQGIQGVSQERNIKNSTIYNFFPAKHHKRQNTQDKAVYWSQKHDTRNPVPKPRINSYFLKNQIS